MLQAKRDFTAELSFRFSRSSGPGGQSVNKVNTRVEVGFNIRHSLLLSEYEKNRLTQKLSNKINKDGELWMDAQTERSQIRNKEVAIKKTHQVLNQALARPKFRVSTKPSKSAKRKRLENKKQHGQKKTMRKKPEL